MNYLLFLTPLVVLAIGLFFYRPSQQFIKRRCQRKQDSRQARLARLDGVMTGKRDIDDDSRYGVDAFELSVVLQ